VIPRQTVLLVAAILALSAALTAACIVVDSKLGLDPTPSLPLPFLPPKPPANARCGRCNTVWYVPGVGDMSWEQTWMYRPPCPRCGKCAPLGSVLMGG
jgi:hypothetical protein